MAETTIPIDPRNPGQVFACLGFMEAAEILMGDAEGAFGWSDPAREVFHLRAAGEGDPVSEVLNFVCTAEIAVLAPAAIDAAWGVETHASEVFPCAPTQGTGSSKVISASALPVELRSASATIPIHHWADGTRSNTMKTFAGQQVGHELYSVQRGFLDMVLKETPDAIADPFGERNHTALRPVRDKRFAFDARGAWDALQSGFSLDKQGKMPTRISPAVECLAPIGLQNARPLSERGGVLRYAIWSNMLPPVLARTVLGHADVLGHAKTRRFRTQTGPSDYYKKLYFAEEET